jgi:ABC-2 type transport system ATP-binding protein
MAGDEPVALVRFRLPADADRVPDLIAREATVAGGVLEIRTEDPTRVLHDLTGWALDRGLALEELTVMRPSLEDVYLELTRDQAPVGGAE